MSVARYAVCALLAASLGCGVRSASGQEFLIDFGPSSLLSGAAATPSPDGNGNAWNNMVPGQPVRLVDTSGENAASTSPLGIRLEAITSFGTSIFGDEGLLVPDAAVFGTLAVASATRDYAFRLSNAGSDIRFRIADVDPTRTFTLELLGSTAGGAFSETRYTVTGDGPTQTATLATSGNTDRLAVFTGVRPDASGEIQVRLEANEGEFMYLNAARLRVVPRGPEITFTRQPSAAIADGGGSLVFSAAATSGEPGLAMRWERDGVPLEDGPRVSGSASDKLTIRGVGIEDVGMYRLVATVGGTTEASESVAGVVRATPLGAVDADGNQSLDFFDVLRFLESYEEVAP